VYKRLWCVLAALLLVTLGTTGATSPLAHATPTVTTVAWPDVYLPTAFAYAHGDGSFSVMPGRSCTSDYTGTSLATATLDANNTIIGTVGADANWQPCMNSDYTPGKIVGSDQTIYMVQLQVPSPNAQRIIALRGNRTTWITTFPKSNCNIQPRIAGLAMGFDGNLYAELAYSGSSPCTSSLSLVSLNSANGAIRFQSSLAVNASGMDDGLFTGDLYPYNNGIAVVNNGNNVYYYSYNGNLDTSNTFSMPPTDTSPNYASITAEGRTFLRDGGTNSRWPNLYYKDLGDTTVHQIATPAGKRLYYPVALPSGGVATLVSDSTSSNYWLEYYDQNGVNLYEKDLTSATGYSSNTMRPLLVTDTSGNAIVVRTMMRAASPWDQEVYVDTFDVNGNMTRLFDSEAQFGTSNQDIFSTNNTNKPMSQIVGNGKIYLTLCHQTSGSATYCSSDRNPQIVIIPDPGVMGYPQTQNLVQQAGQVQYVALGDSYSSGEGNPPFIAPTDNNGGDGCDRSQSHAYPVLLPADAGFSLRAFVACSGATSDEIYTGLHGEPSQFSSLDADTDIVTVTAGGDDAGFADFAAECVIGTCDAASSQYQSTMNEITNYLQSNLELLFSRIRAAAPNAAIKVVGYPEVVPGSGGSCPTYISSGEQSAIDTVITGLNTKLQLAVNNAGTGFQFIDPTMTGSPFEGHDLCSASPYFFGLNIAEHRFSFHPDADGQAAYEELIANLI
jgi:hypothetical protein